MISSNEYKNSLNKAAVTHNVPQHFSDFIAEMTVLLQPPAKDIRIWIAPWEYQKGDL